MYAKVVSSLCLFLLVAGGGAYALSGHNTVKSDDIVNGAVTAKDLKDVEFLKAVGPVRVDDNPGDMASENRTLVSNGTFRVYGQCEEGGLVHARIMVATTVAGPDPQAALVSDSSGGDVHSNNFVSGNDLEIADQAESAGVNPLSVDYTAYVEGGKMLAGRATANAFGDRCVFTATGIG